MIRPGDRVCSTYDNPDRHMLFQRLGFVDRTHPLLDRRELEPIMVDLSPRAHSLALAVVAINTHRGPSDTVLVLSSGTIGWAWADSLRKLS